MDRIQYWRAAVAAAAAAASLIGAAPSAAAVVESTQGVPQAVYGKLAWTPTGQLWSASSVAPSIQRGKLGADGKVRWTAGAPVPGVAGWRAIAAGEDGSVYLGGATSGENPVAGVVAKANATTGKIVWIRKTVAPVVAMQPRVGGGVLALTSTPENPIAQLVGLSAKGRFDLRVADVPVMLPNALRQMPLARDTVTGQPTVLGYRDDPGPWYVATLAASGAWGLREAPQPDDPWSTLVPAAGGFWVFGDSGDSGGAVAQISSAGVAAATIGGPPCPVASFGSVTPAFRAAAAPAPDGALWLRAGCFNDEDALGDAGWLRVAPGNPNPTAELVPASGSADLTGVRSVTVGPDQALWSLDSDFGKLVRTQLPGVGVPPAATMLFARRSGRSVSVRLQCSQPIGQVCSGTLRIKRGATVVASGKYMLAGGPLALRPYVTRVLTIPRGARRASLRAVVSGQTTTVRVR